ncbi:hypothetical protein VE00_11101 [Pseudogymnoascus sp. WSF 3629]|nr:hypothetical protein VE00_11101 [Pseudogymnoascus sp. WSF 3629]
MFLSSISIASVSVLAGALGVISHLGYFIHGEHHMQSVRILCTFVLGPLIFFACELFLYDFPIIEAGKATIVASTSYFVALTLSILSYRVFFHPLRHFPGPFSARLTKLTHVARLLPNSDNFAQAHQLHQKYGEIVRVGPNELTIINPDAIAAIHSSSSRCIKAPWYDAIGGPNPSLQLTRNRNTHDKRRKVWDQAFSARALRNYEGRVDGYVDQLIAQLDNLANQPVNASLWFNFYSFDVMGDLAFGKSFDMLKSGEKHFALKLLQDGMRPVGILTPIPWILPILLAIPGAGTGTKIFTKFIEDQAATRRKVQFQPNTPLLPDITSWLLDAEENSPDPMNKNPRQAT